MGLFKGNRGNLLQHWTLCESLASLTNLGINNLHLACTHSMAPWSIPVWKETEATDACRRIFRTAAGRLANVQNPTIYEKEWHRLSVSSGLPYPSTAVFASEVWQGEISLALCEASTPVADEIHGWLNGPIVEQRLAQSVLLRGDWRSAVSNPMFVRSSSECIYIEMDPMRYDSRDLTVRRQSEPATLYPEDIALLVDALKIEKRPIVLQISSFNNQNANSIETKEQSLSGLLTPAGFLLNDRLAVERQMVSFIYCRGIKFPLNVLQARFSTWIAGL